jgi:uncharacterized protein (TIGR02117 family)
MARILGRLCDVGLILLALGMIYAAAGLVGGTLPANAGWRPPDQGVRIYVEDNGIHTGIVLPLVGGGADWRDILRPEHLRDRRYARYGWRSFGWGDRDFYVNTPTWGDLSPITVARAAIGSEATVMHVNAVPEPRLKRDVRAITLRPEEYRRLVAFIRASFADGAPQFGYGGWDSFYPARGRYSAIRTCNSWTGEALRAAGVRMGAWTPFPKTVMAWLPAS